MAEFQGTVKSYVSSGIFVVPDDGDYLFIVTGCGGKTTQWGNGHSSGGGGGVIYGKLTLKKSENVIITIGEDATPAICAYKSSALTAQAGGTTSESTVPATGGTTSVTGTDFKGVQQFTGQPGVYMGTSPSSAQILEGGMAGTNDPICPQNLGRGESGFASNGPKAWPLTRQTGCVLVIY